MNVKWGNMTVTCPDAGDELLYQGPVDGFVGFEEYEREAKLLFALDLIATRMPNA